MTRVRTPHKRGWKYFKMAGGSSQKVGLKRLLVITIVITSAIIQMATII